MKKLVSLGYDLYALNVLKGGFDDIYWRTTCSIPTKAGGLFTKYGVPGEYLFNIDQAINQMLK